MFKRSMLVAASCAAMSAGAGTNQWTPVGPDGTSAYAGIEYLSRPGHAVAVTLRGVYRTSNHGATWVRTAEFPTHVFYGGLAANPNPAMADQVLAHGDGSNAILRSLDGGATWTAVRPVPGGSQVSAVAFSANGAVAWAAKTSGEVYRSADAGDTWTDLGAVASSPITRIEVDAVDPQVAYLHAGADLWRTANGGGTWTEISGAANYFYIAASPVTSGLLLATGFTTDFEFLRSVDGGNNFASTGIVDATGAMGFDPADGNRLFVVDGNRRIHISTNGGVAWTAGGLLPPGSPISVSADTAAPDNLLVATNAGIAYSSDGGQTWSDRHAGIREAYFLDLVAGRSPDNYVYAPSADSQFLYRRDPATGNWSGIAATADSVVRDTAINGTVLGFAESPIGARDLFLVRDSRIGRSGDDGASWQALATVADSRSITLDPTNPLVAYLGSFNGASNKSLDGGATWTPLGGGLPDGISGLLVDPSSPQTVYAWRDSERAPLPGLIFKSVDGGGVWTRSDSQLTGTQIWSLVVHPARPATMFAGMNNGLWKSDNGGADWQQLVNTQGGNVTHIVVDPQSPEILYITTNHAGAATLRSVDGGQSWESVNANAGLGTFDTASHMVLVPGQPATLLQSRVAGGLWEMEIAPDVRLSAGSTLLVMGIPQTVNYTLSNAGPFAATGITFTLSLPPAVAVTVDSGAMSCTQGVQLVTCQLPVLASGASRPFSIGLTPGAPDEELRGIVSGYEPDAQVGNNVLTIVTQRRADLRGQLTSSTDAAQTGNTFTYSVNVTNLGPSVASAIVADLQLPAGTTLATVTANGLNCTHNAGMIRCTADSLAVDASISANVTVNAVTAGAASAMLTVTGEGNDPDAANNSASTVVTLTAPPPPPSSSSSSSGGGSSSGGSSSSGGAAAGGGGGGGRLDYLLLALLASGLLRVARRR